MQQNIYYQEFALRFAEKQTDELVAIYNSQVKNPGWVGMRACHDLALIDELRRRGHKLTPSICL